ncbi:hypothetical protein MTR72_13680 [Bradyrhizobium sp. ISRA442]|uniref:hypothetical protein n=1 Tax=Bradyrhizobium sp. ISRA442 TaxID=2866197 RepID=UPI00311B19FB
MTRSYFELPKDPFSANDNFQELQSEFPADSSCKIPQISRDSLPEGDENRLRPSYMVSGAAGVKHTDRGEVLHPGADPFANWTKKTKIGRRSITRQLTLRQVRDLKSAWHHAKTVGQPVNRFITFRPHDINDQDAEQRIDTWWRWRNKLAQFARDNDFDFTCLWTRESERHTGKNEHLHVLMHVPRSLQKRFDRVVEAWCDGTDEIDVRGCTYQIRRNERGGEESVLTYIAKNSPQANRFLNHTVQYGGPIFGKRYGLSSNLTAKARARAAVAGGLRQDLRLPRVTSEVNQPVPKPANDQGRKGNRNRAA